MAKPSSLSPRLLKVLERATEFAERQELTAVLHAVSRDPKLWEEARRNARGFLQSRGINLPDGLAMSFLDHPERGKPGPDYEFFTIRFFNCKTYWIKKDGGGVEKVEICWGFEIVPHPLPPIA